MSSNLYRIDIIFFFFPRNGEFPSSKLCCHLVSPLGKEINRHCYMAQFARNADWAEPSPMFAHRVRPTPLKYKNEYLVLALREDTAVHAVVGSIVLPMQ